MYKVKTKEELEEIIFDGKIHLDTLDVSAITNMSHLFKGVTEIKGDISGWDVSNVTSMQGMFQDSRIQPDISKWDTSKVTTMNSMFSNSLFNKDISNWDTSKVTNMEYMFYESKFNQDISKWNVSSVKRMDYMFANSPFNQDISSWNISSLKYTTMMFYKSSFNQNLGSWDLSKCEATHGMFFHSDMYMEDYESDRAKYLKKMSIQDSKIEKAMREKEETKYSNISATEKEIVKKPEEEIVLNSIEFEF